MLPLKSSDEPAIELRLLGGLSVRDRSGREHTSAALQPKRTALLAYLAINGSRGFTQRDTLIGLLWPELEQERARAALSQSLYSLRRALGVELFRTRGNDEVAIDPAVVGVDVAGFENALAAGRFEDGLAFYQGELLGGFYVSGVPEFERWLDLERARLSQLARKSAWALSERALDQGESRVAIEWARRAYGMSRHDEGDLRRLIGTLADAGNVAGALHAYDDFARWLRNEYDAEPATVTRQLVERLRVRAAESVEAVRADPEPAPISEPAPAAAVAPVAGSATNSRLRRTLLIATGIIVLAGSWVVWQRRAAGQPARTRVAVLPFVVRGSGDIDYLKDGMVDLLSARLDGAGPIRTVDPQALLHFIKRAQDTTIAPTQAKAIAQRFNAGLYVMGSIVEAGGKLQATATLYDAEGTAQGRGDAEVASEEGILAMVDELARELLSSQFEGPAARLERAGVSATASFPAVKTYLVGESHYRAGKYAEAFEAYSNAVAIDSTFALAHYRLAMTADWVGAIPILVTSLETALRHADQLDGRERALVNAFNLFWHGTAAEAEAAYNGILRTYPDDVDAWYQYGEVLFHLGQMLGRPASDARPAFERVLALQPDNSSAAAHLARIAALERSPQRVDSLVRRVQLLDPDLERTPEILLLRAYATGDTAEARKLVANLSSESDYGVWVAAWRVAAYVQDFDGAIAIIRANMSPGRSAAFRESAYLSMAHFEVARGRWRAARQLLARAETFAPATSLQTAAFLEALPFSPARTDELEKLRLRIAALQIADTLHPLLAEGLLFARAGQVDSARARLAAITSLSDVSKSEIRPAHEFGLRAAIAFATPDTRIKRRTLDVLAAPRKRGSLVTRNAAYTSSFELFLRAELLLELQRYDEALTWYGALGDDFSYDAVLLAPAHLRRAEILDRQGRSAEAVREYVRFVELWKDCDPELRPTLARAQQRIRALNKK